METLLRIPKKKHFKMETLLQIPTKKQEGSVPAREYSFMEAFLKGYAFTQGNIHLKAFFQKVEILQKEDSLKED
jgi:hypothetical protein